MINRRRLAKLFKMQEEHLPRILYVVVLDPTHKFGSLEEQIVHLARACENSGSIFCPLFICRERKTGATIFDATGIKIECLDLSIFNFSKLLTLSRLISQLQITLVHWNFTDIFRNAYLWVLSVLHPAVRHCFTDHVSRVPGIRPKPSRTKAYLRHVLSQRYTKIICVSKFVSDDLKEMGIRSRVTVCHHFINTERFRPDNSVRETLRRQMKAEGHFVVLSAAHLIEAKGVDIVIRALATLPSDVHLWILGDGEESQKLVRLTKDLNLEGRVVFWGLQRDVSPFMQTADCFVCPSVWEEAAGLVNLEASACGLPVIATRTGGIPEYIEDGRTGLLFSSGDYKALAACIQRLTQDLPLRKQMSLQARNWASDKFRVETGVARYLDLYRS